MLEQETLVEHAMALYRQRDTALQQYRIDLVRLLNTEGQLRELVFALSRIKPDEDNEATLAAEPWKM
ncbi:MAG: hypothetical protein PVJ39_21115 [Gammaproteobacteria bacterium]|jgi:hypothetical protein